MRVLYAASEVAPFAKTGGLADVAASLPRALRQRGHEVAVVMPLYRAIRTGPFGAAPTGLSFEATLGSRVVTGNFWRTTLPDSDVPVYLVEQPDYFDRDIPKTGAGLYQYIRADGARVDYLDNCERFVFFNRAVLELPRLLNFWPDVLHINDWQTGLIPIYLKELYANHPQVELRQNYRAIKTLLTIHNLAYQGLFWHLDMPLTGLPWRLFNHENLEFYGKLNFLKAGIVHAHLLSTVSPTYAKEIQTPYYGCGLQSVLLGRQKDLFGIVNGIDEHVWDPRTDPALAANYNADTVAVGKPVCKRALQAYFGLPQEAGIPLLAVVSRLAEQKGISLLGEIAPAVLEKAVQLIVLGEGQAEYHRMLATLQARFPTQVGLKMGQDEALAHRIEAGADMFLMPSLYEPCGLSQLYSLKYGAVPVVRATGGLCDTVVDATAERIEDGTGTGFVFAAMSASAFASTVERAMELFQLKPEQWLALMRNGMRQDWSWHRSAAEYERLFEELTKRF
jgi:starch synthase